MFEKEQVKSKNTTNAAALVIIVGLAAYYIINHAGTSAAVLLSFFGLGVVIFIHELGHFIAGKLSDVGVEAFSVGFGPIFIGIKKCLNGFRVRVLPTLFLKDDDEQGDGLLCFTIGGRFKKEGETEYQIRLIPLGGFVKLMGQEDVGADKLSDDPRSFVNKPIWKRVVVGSSGVAMNVVLAVALFVFVYTVGINFPPAVIGGVLDGYPAAKAGLQAGDEIIEVNGKDGQLNFSDVAMASALAGKDKPISLEVKRRDGSLEKLIITPERIPGAGFSGIGITPAASLEVAKLSDDSFFKKTGINAGDRLTAVNDKPIKHFWQYSEIIKSVFSPSVSLTFERKDNSRPIVYNVPMEYLSSYSYKEGGKFVPASIYGLVPRLKISFVTADVSDRLDKGDIIVGAAGVYLPDYKQLRELTNARTGEVMTINVLRDGKVVDVDVMPKLDEDGRGRIGVGIVLDVEHPVIARMADVNDSTIPAGAEIEFISGKTVKNFFDIAADFNAARGKTVKVIFSIDGRNRTVDFAVAGDGTVLTRAMMAEGIPFKPLTRLYKASGPVEAVEIGWDKTTGFVLQSYMTIKGLIVRQISPKGLMGPVGIISASSKIIAEGKFLQYINFLAIISACLAVMNFLPLPILDGGLVVMLIIEKIKGSPVNEKVQEVVNYIGLALIAGLFILITYNDIVRLLKGVL